MAISLLPARGDSPAPSGAVGDAVLQRQWALHQIASFFTLLWLQPCCSTAPSPLGLRGSACSNQDLYIYFLKAIKETDVALFVERLGAGAQECWKDEHRHCGLRESPWKRHPSPGYPTDIPNGIEYPTSQSIGNRTPHSLFHLPVWLQFM